MISVVVPTLNRQESLVKLVDSIHSQILSLPVEILVVFNDAATAAQSRLAPHRNLRILSAPKCGVNYARNEGVKQAQGSVLVFIDDDCVVTSPYFLQTHFELHQQYPKMAALGGPYVLPPKSTFWDRVYQKNNELWIEANITERERSMALLGGNASYKKDVFQPGYRFTEEIEYGGSRP